MMKRYSILFNDNATNCTEMSSVEFSTARNAWDAFYRAARAGVDVAFFDTINGITSESLKANSAPESGEIYILNKKSTTVREGDYDNWVLDADRVERHIRALKLAAIVDHASYSLKVI